MLKKFQKLGLILGLMCAAGLVFANKSSCLAMESKPTSQFECGEIHFNLTCPVCRAKIDYFSVEENTEAGFLNVIMSDIRKTYCCDSCKQSSHFFNFLDTETQEKIEKIVSEKIGSNTTCTKKK